MVELQLPEGRDGHQSQYDGDPVIVVFAAVTVLLVVVHLFALMVSTCVLPYLDQAVEHATIDLDARYEEEMENMAEDPHPDMPVQERQRLPARASPQLGDGHSPYGTPARRSPAEMGTPREKAGVADEVASRDGVFVSAAPGGAVAPVPLDGRPSASRLLRRSISGVLDEDLTGETDVDLLDLGTGPGASAAVHGKHGSASTLLSPRTAQTSTPPPPAGSTAGTAIPANGARVPTIVLTRPSASSSPEGSPPGQSPSQPKRRPLIRPPPLAPTAEAALSSDDSSHYTTAPPSPPTPPVKIDDTSKGEVPAAGIRRRSAPSTMEGDAAHVVGKAAASLLQPPHAISRTATAPDGAGRRRRRLTSTAAAPTSPAFSAAFPLPLDDLASDEMAALRRQQTADVEERLKTYQGFERYIETSWIFATALGSYLFLVELGLLVHLKFVAHTPLAGWVGLGVLVPLSFFFVWFAVVFYSRVVVGQTSSLRRGFSDLDRLHDLAHVVVESHRQYPRRPLTDDVSMVSGSSHFRRNTVNYPVGFNRARRARATHTRATHAYLDENAYSNV
jgi:hypothetical protein